MTPGNKDIGPILDRQNNDGEKFPHKSRLLRSYADLSEDQFEYLCIALTEGDLTSEQEEEVLAAADADPGRAEILSIYRNLRLRPEMVIYPGRKGLKRLTVAGKVIRLGTAVFAAAATVAVLVTVINTTPTAVMPLPGNNLAEAGAGVSASEAGASGRIDDNPVAGHVAEIPVRRSVTAVSRPQKEPETPETDPGESIIAENTTFTDRVLIGVLPVSGTPAVVPVTTVSPQPQLAEVFLAEAGEYHGTLSLRDHVAITFREKLLGEKVADASPLRGYEIASVGISGINRLLGWDMNLAYQQANNGEVNSLAFSSRLVNFHTPAKKGEDLR